MLSMVNYTYDASGVRKLSDWGFGTNWPVVYIIYNEKDAYVGETIDAVRRTEQHLQEDSFTQFTSICLISDRTFNKSVTLDLESFLIKYMSADGLRKLTNGNAGISNHDYFYREAYEDDFRQVWDWLLDNGLAQHSLMEIENSELFKYSPYKSLNREQLGAAYDILDWLNRSNNHTSKTLAIVNGGAGTGKSILAVYIIKLLADITENKEPWSTIEDAAEARRLRRLSRGLLTLRRIGFVVPMNQLRETMKDVFGSIDGLSADMVLSPESVVNGDYDLLVVDEAHRLYRRHHLPGSHLYSKFDKINRHLMGSGFTGSESDWTELDWIIKSSRLQLLFYDENQFIRATDIGKARFNSICQQRVSIEYELTSQMRCRGGNGYYEYVSKVIREIGCDARDYKTINNYHLRFFDHITDLFSAIETADASGGICRVVTGPGWKMGEDIVIEGSTYHWAHGGESAGSGSIYSIHKTQGFDLNYAGVIFGKEVYYDEALHGIAVNKGELRDNHTKSGGADEMREFVLNIYVTLMTRGIDGTFVYAVDKRLRDYLKQFF